MENESVETTHTGTDDQSLVSIPETFAINALTRNKSFYHVKRKKVELKLVLKAAANKPFNGLARPTTGAEAINEMDQETLARVAEMYLKVQFAGFERLGAFLGIEPEGPDEWERLMQKEANDVENARARYREAQLIGQLDALERTYESLQGVRSMFRYLRKENLLQPNSILNISYMPHLLAAAPVWFLWDKDGIEQNDGDDPYIDPASRKICVAGKTQQFADLYLLFNRRPRPFEKFEGDIMPPEIAKVVKEAKQHFNQLVIATPYHHIASREWADPRWQSLIDPFLIGFHNEVPETMFFLGRWSNTGLFPLVDEMVADTIEFIRTHLNAINAFGNPYWFDAKNPFSRGSSFGSSALPIFAKKLVTAYENNQLFPFLAGEKV